MAEWDFESALNDYFGTSSEDDDTPLGVAGSATFSAPSGWDFDKALNDYFSNLNDYSAPSRYIAPRGYELPSDYDSTARFDALQRRHDAWEAQREQQELFRAPRGYIAPSGYEYPGEMTPPNEWGLSYPIVPPGPSEEGIINKWLGNFLPTPEEEELSRRLPWWGIGSMPYAARVAGNLFAPVGAANEWARQNVPGVGGAENLAGNVLRYSQVFPLFGAAIMEAHAQGPAQQAYDEYVKTLDQYLPATPEQQARLDELRQAAFNERQAGVRKQIEEMGLNPDRWQDRLEAGHRAYEENVPEAVRLGLSFVDPGYWALGLAGRGLVSGARSLAAKATNLEGAQAAKGLRAPIAEPQPSLAGLPSGGTSRLEKLTELEELRGDLATTKSKEYAGRWTKSLSETVGRKVTGPADLTDAELDKVLEVYRDRASKTLPPLSAEAKATKQIIDWLYREVAPYRKLEFTPENWRAEFGEKLTVQTPIVEVKMGEHQFEKLVREGRTQYFGLIKPTLKEPLLILKDKQGATVFLKTFVDENDITRFISVAVDKAGKEVIISSHPIQPRQLRQIVKSGELLYVRRATTLGATPPMSQ